MADKSTIHKRVHMDITTDILVDTLAKLTGSTYQEALEAAILFGIAYINDRNKLEMTKWISQVTLPDLKDIEEILK